MFAQAVYLMFAAVYVSKEAVEHFLLHSDSASAHKHAGGAHAGVTGHHHHPPEGGAIGCVFLAHSPRILANRLLGWTFQSFSSPWHCSRPWAPRLRTTTIPCLQTVRLSRDKWR